MTWWWSNRPFPGSPRPLYQNEVRCSAFDMKMIFYSHANKTHFKRLCTWSHFESEGFWNSEGAYLFFSFLCDCPRNFNGNGDEKYYCKKQIDLNFPCSILLSTIEVTSICSKLEHIELWNLNFEHFDVTFMADKNYRLWKLLSIC